MKKTLFFIAFLLCFYSIQGFSKETIEGFTITIAGKFGEKKAIIGGDTAEVLPDGRIKINNVVARVFEKNHEGDTIVNTASCYYDKSQNLIETDEFVRITRYNMEIKGNGMFWDPNRFIAIIERNVTIEYRHSRNVELDEDGNPLKKGDEEQVVTEITSDGKLRYYYDKGVATLHKGVKIRDRLVEMNAHTVRVFFGKDEKGLKRFEAFGLVHIVQPQRLSYCRKAVYDIGEDKLVLEGYPRIVQKDDLYTADIITIYDKGSRVIFEPSAELVIYIDE